MGKSVSESAITDEDKITRGQLIPVVGGLAEDNNR